MHKIMVFSPLVLAACLVTACDNTKSNVAEPTALAAAGVSADVTAGAPVADSAGNRSCPAFTIPLKLTLRAGGLDIAVTDVTMRFVDSSGIPMPPVTLPAPVPTTQIGSDLIAARSARTIPLAISIGCTAHPAGTVVVVVGTRDGRGRRGSVEVRTPVH
jgi:hypothetical protein